MNPKENQNLILKQKKPWDDNRNDIWLASTLSLFRNVENFMFPAKMSSDRRKQIVPLLTKELLKNSEFKNPIFYKAEDLSPNIKLFLVEHFLSTFSYQATYAGEGFLLDETGQLLCTLNIHDHLHLHLIDVKGEIERTWNQLIKIEMEVGKAFNYCYSPRFGFLTSNPAYCGTGLNISLFLQPTALIHTGKIDEFIEKNGDKSIAITGLQGNPTEIIGDVLAIKNQYTLGINEENIISTLRAFATKLLLEETTARHEIKQQDNAVMKDKVSRAYGVLIHSYQIDAVEALNAISLVKLGSELGWLKGATTAQLNQLFFNCRKAHLVDNFSEEIKQEELPHKRAEFIHKSLQKLQLKI